MSARPQLSSAAGDRSEPSARRLDSPYMSELRYAPGLDGVRAFAVAAVLLYHARVPWAPGGFLGVDVFFVLSGYLITSLLLAENRRSGRIDLRRFWVGRARRLLPAAIVVICVCLLIGALFLQGDLNKIRSDSLASLLYVNNWHQILARHSYFAAFGRPSLLQHYWSLSVEEQFYLVWPILLTGGLAIGLARRWLASIVVAAGVMSVVLMALVYHSGSDPSRVYYGTDTRAAPLMIGTIMAFAWPLGRMTGRAGRGAPTLLDGVGLAGLAGLVLLMHAWHDYDSFLYRGGFVIVAVAAAAVIAAAGHPASSLARVLGTRPLRWIGQRSYGIYLWHWPVMALTRPGVDVHWSTWIVVTIQVGVTLVLATLSYRYVEMPVRRGEAWRVLRTWFDRRQPRQRLAAAATVCLITCGVIGGLALLPAKSARSPLSSLESAAAATRIAKPPSNGAAGGAVSPPPAVYARQGGAPAGGPPGAGAVLAVGSSVMLAAQPALEHRLHARVDATVGRFNAAILDRLQVYRDAGALPPNVVVQVGDNDPLTGAQLARLRAVLRGVPDVVLVNIREPDESWEGEVNAALAQAVRSWPAASVADWRSASANQSLTWDGTHPNPAGQDVYADVVARSLHAHLTSPSTGTSVRATIVADSIAEGIDETPQALRALTHDLRLRLDLKVCRRLTTPSCAYPGAPPPPPALSVVRSLGRSLGPLLIIEVGYNEDPAGYGSGIDRIMHAALGQGARQVAWVTLREAGPDASTYHATNVAIRRAAGRWSQLRVADWNAYSSGKPWFADDAVHLNPAGASGLAAFLRSYITG
jgi:peptidoglycan/LPS O-acetylase OafA/YrhL